jgi:hypothetical protein
MSLTSTRTHTVYWNERDIAPMLAELAKLRIDFKRRRPYVDLIAAQAMQSRLDALQAILNTLTERVD